MPVTVKYKVLFSVDVWHHFFLDKGERHFESLNTLQKVKQLGRYHVNNFFEIIPSEDCRRWMRNLQLVYRPTASGLIVGTPTDDSGNQPKIEIPSDAKFTFYIKLAPSYFYNYTNLPLNVEAGQLYYFSNLGKSDANQLNLSSPLDTFQNGGTYYSGQMVLSDDGRTLFRVNKNTTNAVNQDLEEELVAPAFSNASDYVKGDIVQRKIGGIDQLFEAKKDDPSGNPQNNPAGDWTLKRDLPLNYLNENDRLALQYKLFKFNLPSDNINAKVRLFSRTSEGDTLVQEDDIAAGSSALQVDWRNQSNGAYRIEITNEDVADNDPAKMLFTSEFYLVEQMQAASLFGVIDIYANRADDNNFALLAGNGTFQNTENQYFIRIKNRHTLWRYLFREGQAVPGNSKLKVESDDDKVLVTKEPQPLTAMGGIDIQQDDRQLPNPNANTIKPESENNFSEIYINL